MVDVAESGHIGSINMFLVFVIEKDTPEEMKFPIVTKGAGKYEFDQQLKMLDRVSIFLHAKLLYT